MNQFLQNSQIYPAILINHQKTNSPISLMSPASVYGPSRSEPCFKNTSPRCHNLNAIYMVKSPSFLPVLQWQWFVGEEFHDNRVMVKKVMTNSCLCEILRVCVFPMFRYWFRSLSSLKHYTEIIKWLHSANMLLIWYVRTNIRVYDECQIKTTLKPIMWKYIKSILFSSNTPILMNRGQAAF